MIDLAFAILVFAVLAVVIIVILALFTSFIVAVFGGGPFVPTPTKEVKRILKHANIRKGDRLYDIGAGDGRFIHYATKLYGAKATGFEIDPFVYMLARLRQIFLKWKGEMVRADFQSHSLKDADIIICYMLPNTLKKFKTKFEKELRPGCKVISYTFKVGNWKPIKILPKSKKRHQKRIYIYSVRDNSAKTRTKKKTISKRK